MKRLLAIYLSLVLTQASAQLWFDVGLKGGGGSGFLFNKNISSDSRLSLNPGYNYFFGGKIGINYGYYISVATDITYGKQSFSFNQAELLGSSTTFRYGIDYNSLNIAPLFRYTKEASYIEIGPEFSFIKNPTYTDEAISPLSVDATAELNSKITQLVFGFGGYIVGNEIVALQMGLRLHYSLSNLTSYDFESSRFPLTNYPDLQAGVPSNPFMIQLHLELNFSLGQIARSTTKCGKRVAFLTF